MTQTPIFLDLCLLFGRITRCYKKAPNHAAALRRSTVGYEGMAPFRGFLFTGVFIVIIIIQLIIDIIDTIIIIVIVDSSNSIFE